MASPGVRYLVELDLGAGKWNASRGGKATGSFARDMQTAIGLASKMAQLEASITHLGVTVWTDVAGQKTMVWPS
jgi:hypothetical protein